MSTTLLTLRGRLQDLLGDKNQAYSEYYNDAINNAIREVYPNLYEALENKTLITGNILPNSHFEDWAVSSGATAVPDFYTLTPTSTATKTTTAGLIRGGATSMLVTAGAADDYVYITSDNYPRLLDLMGHTINIQVWALPSTADDVFMDVYYRESDGTIATQSTTTTATVNQFNLLTADNIEIPDNIVAIQFNFRVHTNGETCYFDNARVTGLGQYEFLLPTDFRKGNVDEVFIQSSGLAGYPCDDLNPRIWDRVYGFNLEDDGTYKYLRMPALYSDNYQIRLLGRKPLDTMSADTGSINIDNENHIQLLLRYAAHLVYEMQADGVGADDITRYERAAQKQLAKYYELIRAHGMPAPRKFINRSLA